MSCKYLNNIRVSGAFGSVSEAQADKHRMFPSRRHRPISGDEPSRCQIMRRLRTRADTGSLCVSGRWRAIAKNKCRKKYARNVFTVAAKFVVGRAGFEPAANGLKVAGRAGETLLISDLQRLPSSSVNVTQGHNWLVNRIHVTEASHMEEDICASRLGYINAQDREAINRALNSVTSPP